MAAFQFTLATGFMLLFRFPKWMIGAFAVMILVGTLVASATKSKVASRSVAPQRPITRPILLRFVGAGLALFSFAALAFLLLGSVMFLNSWNDWHRYEGQPYHVTTFQVRQTYWQRQSKGGPDIYASGIVEGHREWISLQPYVHDRMRNPQELDARVPAGTAIPIYFFPDMKGRLRVRVYQGVPLADAYHQTALNAAKYGSIGLAICIGVIFLLLRIQKTCFAEEDNFQQLGASAGR
ncbi:MAG TPA: hypothetical protein VGS27_12325 [Candidatus Sulfotelmatobacter sp.]|nr:hypothetical protein [Candidatus Sulfotelmatobacter sp.]